jgi:hypothetical protein
MSAMHCSYEDSRDELYCPSPQVSSCFMRSDVKIYSLHLSMVFHQQSICCIIQMLQCIADKLSNTPFYIFLTTTLLPFILAIFLKQLPI